MENKKIIIEYSSGWGHISNSHHESMEFTDKYIKYDFIQGDERILETPDWMSGQACHVSWLVPLEDFIDNLDKLFEVFSFADHIKDERERMTAICDGDTCTIEIINELGESKEIYPSEDNLYSLGALIKPLIPTHLLRLHRPSFIPFNSKKY